MSYVGFKYKPTFILVIFVVLAAIFITLPASTDELIPADTTLRKRQGGDAGAGNGGGGGRGNRANARHPRRW